MSSIPLQRKHALRAVSAELAASAIGSPFFCVCAFLLTSYQGRRFPFAPRPSAQISVKPCRLQGFLPQRRFTHTRVSSFLLRLFFRQRRYIAPILQLFPRLSARNCLSFAGFSRIKLALPVRVAAFLSRSRASFARTRKV